MTTGTGPASALAEREPPRRLLGLDRLEELPVALEPVLRTERARTRVRATHRLIVAADAFALSLSFLLAGLLVGARWADLAIFAASVPAWIVGARLLGLYDRDTRRIGHSTVDELWPLVGLVTFGAFLLGRVSLVAPGFHVGRAKVTVFWAFALVLVPAFRGIARLLVRRHRMRTLIVGAGIVGQLVARKLRRHPEYGLDLVGFVADDADELPPDLAHVPVVGGPEELAMAAWANDVDRVILAFPPRRPEDVVELVRPLRDRGVQVDIVPRLFDALGPAASMHSLEGLPLIALPSARISPLSLLVKRCVDVIGAGLALALLSPLLAWIAWRIRRDSPGPVLFRQTRLGLDMREFTFLKYRTMNVDASADAHRAFMRTISDRHSAPPTNGLYKYEQGITRFGRFLRRTSLDELPQLINVIRGDMSLVGPRPCIPYETENFAGHHFDRFRVPQGLTGLWQVTARNRSTFAEALDMDVAYARSWSLGLDLRILLLTPVSLLRRGSTA